MRTKLVNHILLACLVTFLLQLCAPSLPFYHDLLPDTELAEQPEKENEKERLKPAEELTDHIPGFIGIYLTTTPSALNNADTRFALKQVYTDVPVPPPDCCAQTVTRFS